MSAKKKSFIDDNPALQFISKETIDAVDGIEETPAATDQEAATAPASSRRHRKRERPEARNRRVQVLMKPSHHEALKAIADREGISVNEAINEAIEDYLANEG